MCKNSQQHVLKAISQKRMIDIIWVSVRIDTSTSALWSRWPARSYQSNNTNRVWYNVIVVRHFHTDKSQKSCPHKRFFAPIRHGRRARVSGRCGRPVKCHFSDSTFLSSMNKNETRKTLNSCYSKICVYVFFLSIIHGRNGRCLCKYVRFSARENSFIISKHCQGRAFRATFISITYDKTDFICIGAYLFQKLLIGE